MRIVCPHCLRVNNIPKKDEYKKANCGGCKRSLLDLNLIEVNTQNFDEIVVNGDLPVIIKFWAPWCRPCRTMEPLFKEISDEYHLKALFIKVNTEAERNLAARFDIRSVPTVMIMKGGDLMHKVSGTQDRVNLKSIINRYI